MENMHVCSKAPLLRPKWAQETPTDGRTAPPLGTALANSGSTKEPPKPEPEIRPTGPEIQIKGQMAGAESSDKAENKQEQHVQQKRTMLIKVERGWSAPLQPPTIAHDGKRNEPAQPIAPPKKTSIIQKTPGRKEIKHPPEKSAPT